jgi:hypothetical protein
MRGHLPPHHYGPIARYQYAMALPSQSRAVLTKRGRPPYRAPRPDRAAAAACTLA